MKYNKKYNRWVTKGGLVYRYDKKKDRLVECKLSYNRCCYLIVSCKKPDNNFLSLGVHRLVYETFVGEIPQGYEIDHLNTIRDDNRVENLRCVTHKENSNNPLSRKHNSESKKGNCFSKGKPSSEFGRKFKEHFSITRTENKKLYQQEYMRYKRHNKICSWEGEDK